MSDLSAWLTELQAASPWDLDTADSAMPQWEEEPVPLEVFVGDARYLANPPLSDEQAEAVRYAERVYMPPAYLQLAQSADKDIRDYWGQPLRLVNFVTLQWGKGGGKDHICRIISMRVAYLLLCLPSPLLYYKLPPQDSIHLLNVASSAPQANNAFFKPMRRAVSRHGCWFEDRCEPLDGVIRYAKNVEAISGHSDAETQEGLNVLLGVADEIDAFKREEELARNRGAQVREATKSAESILNMLRTSGRTRFPEVFKNVRISYPRYKGSMIQVLTGRARKDNDEFGDVSRHYVSGPKATWEVNPRVTGKSVFAEDYRDDPILSEARYECNPSRAINPYFTNEAAIESCLVDAERAPLLVEYVPEKHPVTDPATGRLEIVTTWGTRFDFAAHLYPIQGAQYAMHADLALTNDRAGVTMSHVSRWDEIEVTGKDAEQGDVKVLEHRPRVKVDFSISFAADSAAVPPREIQIRWARDLCFELRRRGFAVRRFTFDGYQSVDSMQILEAAGVETDRLSTDMDHSPWRTLRDLFNECRIEMYHHGRSPEEMQAGQEQTDDERLLNELFGLSKLPNGRIDHLAGGSKDLADSLACSVAGAVELGGMEDPDGKPAFPAQQDYGAPETPIPLPLGFIAPAGAGENGFGPEGVLSSPVDLGYYELGSFAEDYDASLNVVEEFTGPRRPD